MSILLVGLLAIVIFGGSTGIAIWQYNTSMTSSGITTEIAYQPLGNLEQADINMSFTAGTLTISNLPGSSDGLFEARTTAKNNISSINDSVKQSNGKGQITMNSINQQYWPEGIQWEVDFTDKIPLEFSLNGSASSSKLDFSELRLAGLIIELNASSCGIVLPPPYNEIQCSIVANAASMEITLPDDAAARIQSATSLGSLDVDKRFIKMGDLYVTPNYDDTKDRYDLSIKVSLGKVKIN